MATEATIKKRGVEKLQKEGYCVYIPNNTRYGSGTTYAEETKRGNDVFNIIDAIAWKEDEIKLIQWTSAKNVTTREKKIKKFLEENDLEVPAGCELEAWGYVDRQGFKRVIKLNSANGNAS